VVQNRILSKYSRRTVPISSADLQWAYACGMKPQSSCILSQTEGLDVMFYALDPLRGKGAKLGQIKRPYWNSSADWSISPDGLSVAFVTRDGRIEILSVLDQTWHQIRLEPRCQRFDSIAWATHGRGFFISCWGADSFDLVYATLSGTVTRLWPNGRRLWMINPLPSPDGKYLAFQGETWDSNLWVIENF